MINSRWWPDAQADERLPSRDGSWCRDCWRILTRISHRRHAIIIVFALPAVCQGAEWDLQTVQQQVLQRRDLLETIQGQTSVTTTEAEDHDAYFDDVLIYEKHVREFFGLPEPAETPKSLATTHTLPWPDTHMSFALGHSAGRQVLYDGLPNPSIADAKNVRFSECLIDGRWHRYFDNEHGQHRLYIDNTSNLPSALSGAGFDLEALRLPEWRLSEWQTLAGFLDPADSRRSFLDIATGGGSSEALLTITSAVKDAHSPPERPIHDRVRLTLDMDRGFAPIRISHDWCYLKDGAMAESPQDKIVIIEWVGYREHEPGLWVADGLLINTYCDLALPRDGAFQPERDAAGNIVMLAGSAAIDMSSTSIRRYHIKTTTLTNSNVRVNSELPANLCIDSYPADTIIEDRNTGRLSGAVQMVPGGGPVMEIERKPDRRSVVGSAFLITNVAALICFGLWLWVRRSRCLMNGRPDNGRD